MGGTYLKEKKSAVFNSEQKSIFIPLYLDESSFPSGLCVQACGGDLMFAVYTYAELQHSSSLEWGKY